jgi:hypothetical protein
MGGVAHVRDKLYPEQIPVAVTLIGQEEKKGSGKADTLYKKVVHGKEHTPEMEL